MPICALRLSSWILLPALSVSALCGCDKSNQTNKPVTLVLSTITFSQTLYHGDPDIITDFTKKTGIAVKLLPYGNVDMGARRTQHLKWLKDHSETPDVYEADIVDVGTLAPYALDLAPYMNDDDRQHMPAVMRNLTLHGRVVALPVHTDVQLLFYRTDLLKKYGFARAPRTWDELERMAAKIQAGERAAGNKGFWGFVWEGSAQNEGLTYTALEWQASNGGGEIIEPDGTITVNNPWAIAALRRARKWVGTISPQAVTAYQMEDLSNAWMSGRAAFMLNWPHYYWDGRAADSPIRDRVDVAPVPAGALSSAGTLGGWQLLVSQYSTHPKEAVELAQYLTSSETQRRLAIEFNWMPTRPALYSDPKILREGAFFGWLKNDFERLAVARPSGVTGEKYLTVSEAYAEAVHSALTGEDDPADALAKLEKRLVEITGFPVRHPTAPIPFAMTTQPESGR
jgi:trehalose/maltose transport system substrate-binding protein